MVGGWAAATGGLEPVGHVAYGRSVPSTLQSGLCTFVEASSGEVPPLRVAIVENNCERYTAISYVMLNSIKYPLATYAAEEIKGLKGRPSYRMSLADSLHPTSQPLPFALILAISGGALAIVQLVLLKHNYKISLKWLLAGGALGVGVVLYGLTAQPHEPDAIALKQVTLLITVQAKTHTSRGFEWRQVIAVSDKGSYYELGYEYADLIGSTIPAEQTSDAYGVSVLCPVINQRVDCQVRDRAMLLAKVKSKLNLVLALLWFAFTGTSFLLLNNPDK